MARAQGARAQMALAFESVYGTPPAGGAYWRMPFANSNLGAEQPLLASELLGYGRDPITPVKDAITADGDVTIPIDARFLGVWLKALFGAPTTTEDDDVYTHVFASGGWTLPSMAIEVGMPDVPHFAMVSGAVANQISWQMQRSGLVTASVGLIAQGETVGSASSAGSCSAFAGRSVARVRSSATSSARRSPTGTISTASRRSATTAGSTAPIRRWQRLPEPSTSASPVLLNQAIAGAPCKLEFAYAIGADTAFTLTAHAVYLPRPRLPLQDPGGVQASFAWQAALDSVAGRMATATLVNDIADYDNP